MSKFAAFLLAGMAVTACHDMGGVWNVSFKVDKDIDFSHAVCTFQPDGNKLVGSCGEQTGPVIGTVEGRKVIFQFQSGNHLEISATFSGEFEPSRKRIEGVWHALDADSGSPSTGTFYATR